MLGAIIGDIVGSKYEFDNIKTKEFSFVSRGCTFTDDTVMTVAVARALIRMHRDGYFFKAALVEEMKFLGNKYRNAGYGGRFSLWLMIGDDAEPYNSYGNGSAMRVSSVGWIAESEEDVKYFSRLVTEVSHNHPEGIKGAESVAMAIYLARIGASMEEIRARMIEYYPEIATLKVDKIREYCNVDDGTFITCQRSVPEAIVCFLESTSFEDAVRNAVSLGGDADTQGAITGSIAEAYWGVPIELEDKALTYLLPKLETIYYAFNTIKNKRAKNGAR